MRATRFVCASILAGALALVPSKAAAQDNPQALRQEIDQLRKEFDALKPLMEKGFITRDELASSCEQP